MRRKRAGIALQQREAALKRLTKAVIQGMAASAVKDHLRHTFGYSVTQYQNNSLLYLDFTWNRLKTQIGNNHPIFTSCIADEYSPGHAIVIRGYVEGVNETSRGSIFFMDPANGKYRACLVPLDEIFTMTTTTGVIMDMSVFLAVS